MAAVAAMGLSNAGGATIPLAHTSPALLSDATTNIVQFTTITNLDLRQRINANVGITRDVISQATSRMIVTIPSSTDGTLTISWISTIGVWNAPWAIDGEGFSNAAYNVNQVVNFGKVGGPMNKIVTFEGPKWVADNTGYITGSWLNMTQNFSQSINVLKGQTYNFDLWFNSVNTKNAFADSDNFVFSFTPSIDANTNNILDSWEISNFGVLAPADGDPDKDGMNNLMEYALGTNPKQTNQNPAVCWFEVIGGQKYLCMTFPKNPHATNLNYTVEYSENLLDWFPETIKMTTSTTQEKVRSALSTTEAPRLFLRIKVGSQDISIK